jgi:hypothetical protein
MQENEQLSPEELQPQMPHLYNDEETIKTAIDQELEGKTPEELEQLKEALQSAADELDAEDLDKRNYVKISPTFYVQAVDNEDEEDETELFKILNPVEGTVETRELSDDEKKEVLVTQLKQSRKSFNPLSHPVKTIGTETVVSSIGREKRVKTKEYQTNLTVNKYGNAYKQKRKRKNKMAKASRRANR